MKLKNKLMQLKEKSNFNEDLFNSGTLIHKESCNKFKQFSKMKWEMCIELH